ncbi:MAG: indolepyruvate oxidoreductase subunit beta [Firmicutes bacterium]|jgi:indolepyruvate ferredoxin oxidoreductase beta subunit|nr:indolepyruvate oxidoreductase subunit beta [Bacillota bacterium]
MTKTTSILMGGVGGQGIVLASRLLAHVIQAHGYDLKISEIHGMAQRGGSVLTYVRFGSEVHSPLIEAGQADYVLAGEKLEAWRWLPYLRRGGTMVCSTQEIKPLPVITGAERYPEKILAKMQALVDDGLLGGLYAIPALEMAASCGEPKAATVALVGVLAARLEFPGESYLQALADIVPARFLEANKKAFLAGYNYF